MAAKAVVHVVQPMEQFVVQNLELPDIGLAARVVYEQLGWGVLHLVVVLPAS